MLRLAKAVMFFALASGCALLLSACAGGSSGNTPKPAVLTAHANIPSSATAGATFAVSISLTSSNRPTGTATVQLVDVGTATPQIECGASQTLTVNGASQSFTCEAPQITLGSNNSHQLQIDVNGVANLSSPGSVDVVNGGTVAVQLTSASGTAITQAAPGQTVEAAFTTTTTPAGIGGYTVTVPSGWTVGNGGLCNINGQSASCTVPVTIAASAASGSYNFAITAEQGSASLSATSLPISVAVNSGEVDAQVTDVSDTTVTTAVPGQTIGVAFTTTTTPAGAGTYTVTAPSNWTVGNSGVCVVSGQSRICRVPVTVSANASIGSYDLTIAAGQGSSPLSATSLPISVKTQAASSGMAFDLAQNISRTLYANLLPSPTTSFKYQPVFLFKNTSGGTLTIDSANVSGLTNVQYGCNIAAPTQHADYTLGSKANCALTPTGLYAVSGDLNNNITASPSTTAPVGSASISISVQGGGNTYVTQTASVVFVTYQPGYVAVNVKNSDGSPVYIAAVNGGNMITFDRNVGTNSSDPSGADFSLDQFQLSTTGGLLYIPYGISDVINLTHGITNAGVTTGFNTTAPPNPTGLPAPPPYLSVEMTYQQDVPGGLCPTSGSTCENLTVDQTYVNFIAMAGSFNLMGNTKPLALDSESSTHGTVTDLTQSQIFQQIESFFNKDGGSTWKYDSARGQQNYIQVDANGNPTWIFAPIGVYNTSFDPMQSNYYDTYINALWTYLETNPIYVLASGTGESDYATPAPADNCVLKGEVVTSPPAPPADPNLGKLVFNYSSGTCPPAGYAIGPAPYQGALCGPQKNQSCSDTDNTLVFAKFNECDFVNAAGSGDCHPLVDPTTTNPDPQAIDPVTFPQNENLWGPNGTYRAVVGRALASYQAIGLLPPCGDPAEVMSDVNARTDVANGKGFKNPTGCLSGLTSDPIWNVYAAALRPYANVYAYSYGDFLGLDGTVTFSANALPATLYQNLQVAQPVTIQLH